MSPNNKPKAEFLNQINQNLYKKKNAEIRFRLKTQQKELFEELVRKTRFKYCQQYFSHHVNAVITSPVFIRPLLMGGLWDPEHPYKE